jgi:serine protease AprX
MQLSGTSFAAAAVSGAAAYLLALNPHWTPDQVKGALMVSAQPTPSAAPLSNGVGELDLARAALVTNPPNPNAALNRFVVPDPAGGPVPVFDAASWGAAATLDPAWNAASWGAASWGAASWGAASWGAASWGAASWGAASWGATSWSAASWGTASWGAASWGAASWGAASWGAASWGAASWGAASWGSDSVADNADDDVHPGGGYMLDDEQAAIVGADPASG